MSRFLFGLRALTLTASLLAGSAAALGQDQKPTEEDHGQHQQQPGNGGDKLCSVDWGMLGAVHKLGRRYPLLFQTGETAYGTPLVDAQHPHDFVI